MMYCVLRNQKRGQMEHHLFGEFTTLIHLCVCLKGEKAAKVHHQAATAKDLLKTKLTKEDAKLKTICDESVMGQPPFRLAIDISPHSFPPLS